MLNNPFEKKLNEITSYEQKLKILHENWTLTVQGLDPQERRLLSEKHQNMYEEWLDDLSRVKGVDPYNFNEFLGFLAPCVVDNSLFISEDLVELVEDDRELKSKLLGAKCLRFDERVSDPGENTTLFFIDEQWVWSDEL